METFKRYFILTKCVFPPPKVYYPNLGWMCIDATDPEKGNWLRYVNWACSGEEQNLFPLEINRAIYYKTLKVRVLELACR